MLAWPPAVALPPRVLVYCGADAPPADVSAGGLGKTLARNCHEGFRKQDNTAFRPSPHLLYKSAERV